MGQEYPPEKDTSCFAPAPLRRRLHEFYCGRSRFVVLRAAKRTAPTVSFRTPPRGATACRENVFLLLANILASVSQLCRTRIIKRGKIIPRKSLQPNNLQKPSSSVPQKCVDSRSRGERTKKDPSSGFSPTRGQAKGRSIDQRALHRPKGDVRGKWNVPTETRSVDSWMKRSLRRHLRVPGCLPFEKLIPLRLRGCW